MKDLGKIILHIPAREGSKRVPRKNMRDMNGNPMIAYSIESAIDSKVTSEMYVNTDSQEIIDFVNNTYQELNIYKRDKKLTCDATQSDAFNYDIIKKLNPNTLIMINPVCPLIEADDIKSALEFYKNSDCDTLITSTSTQMQTFCEEKAINIKENEELAPSQKNKRVYTLNWAITIWDAEKFIKRMKKNGYAALGDNRIFFDIDDLKAVKVSEEKDFLFIQKLLKMESL